MITSPARDHPDHGELNTHTHTHCIVMIVGDQALPVFIPNNGTLVLKVNKVHDYLTKDQHVHHCEVIENVNVV